MVEYQASVIQEHARRLYARATTIIVLYGFFGLCVGAGAGVTLAGEAPLMLGVALLGALLGAAIGQTRSFQIRLEAQLALCQMQIEQHTRYSATAVARSPQQIASFQGPPPAPGRPR